MARKKKTNTPKNNFYWIYASIIFLIISLSFVGGDKGLQNVQQTDISSFEDFLSNGDVNKITIVNQRYALVSINENALSKEIHRKVKTKNFLGKDNLTGPHYRFEIGPTEIFQKKLDEIKIKENLSFSYEFQTRENRWMDVLVGFLPIIIIIGIWIYLMRRMSGGGAGGAGQIFNIGKSKAKLFDQNAEVKINFRDVAGMEGAKEEVQEIVDFLKNPQKYKTTPN